MPPGARADRRSWDERLELQPLRTHHARPALGDL